MPTIENYTIRRAAPADLEAITELEALCFPAAEAATGETFEGRLRAYADYFFLMVISGQIVGMINGMVTSEADLADRMYEDEGLHDPEGDWQMIFGLDTHPDYRDRGVAAILMRAFIDNARSDKRKGLVLTCKEKLIAYYESFGFVNEGVSESVHGNVVWYQMRLTF